MQSVIATEFVPSPTDRISTSLATYVGDETVICYGSEDYHLPTVPVDLYMLETPPSRLEPDKGCKLDLEIYDPPKITGFFPDAILLFDPERAKSMALARKKAAEEKAKDPCPLILKPMSAPYTAPKPESGFSKIDIMQKE